MTNVSDQAEEIERMFTIEDSVVSREHTRKGWWNARGVFGRKEKNGVCTYV